MDVIPFALPVFDIEPLGIAPLVVVTFRWLFFFFLAACLSPAIIAPPFDIAPAGAELFVIEPVDMAFPEDGLLDIAPPDGLFDIAPPDG